MYYFSPLLTLMGPFFGGVSSHPFVFLYLGPETILPLASFFSALTGIVLIFWRYIVRLGHRLVKVATGQPDQLTPSGNTSSDSKSE